MKKYTLVYVNSRGERLTMGLLAEDRDQAEQRFWANVSHAPEPELVRILEEVITK